MNSCKSKHDEFMEHDFKVAVMMNFMKSVDLNSCALKSARFHKHDNSMKCVNSRFIHSTIVSILVNNLDIVHRTHHVEHTATDTPRTHKDTCTNGAREDDGGKLRLELELRSRTANAIAARARRSSSRSCPRSSIRASHRTSRTPTCAAHRVHAGTALPELLRPTDTRKR